MKYINFSQIKDMIATNGMHGEHQKYLPTIYDERVPVFESLNEYVDYRESEGKSINEATEITREEAMFSGAAVVHVINEFEAASVWCPNLKEVVCLGLVFGENSENISDEIINYFAMNERTRPISAKAVGRLVEKISAEESEAVEFLVNTYPETIERMSQKNK